ncbi:acyl-CoA dehydrogenase [Burkholderia sp. Bp9125]|nr:acyl-CoA dehydrogenase [Burkholderia sp. Bp9125]
MTAIAIEAIGHDAVYARTHQLLKTWQARAATAELTRCIPVETLEELHDAGLMQIVMPNCYGGLGLDWPALAECSRIAARACASTAWMIGLVGGHAMLATRLPQAGQEMLFAKGARQVFSTASVPHDGTIEKEPGGFRLNGAWRFSSGIDHATWIMIHGPCTNPHGTNPAERVLLAAPINDTRIEDTWHVSGMSGTGSKDVRFDHLFIPDCLAVSFSTLFAARPSAAQAPSGPYISDVPLRPYLGSGVIGPILGCAEGAFDEAVSMLRIRLNNSGTTSSASSTACLFERVAQSAAELSCAQKLFDSIVTTLHTAGLARQELDVGTFNVLRRDRAYLVRLCVNAIERLVRQLATAAIFDANPIQRHWRDLQVMATHMDVNWDTAMTEYGAYVLDYELSTPAVSR